MDQHRLELEAAEYFDQLDREYPLAMDAYHSIIASTHRFLRIFYCKFTQPLFQIFIDFSVIT